MTYTYPQDVFAEPAVRSRARRSPHVFDFPPAVHVMLAAGFFAYLGIMWATFHNAELILPFVIFAVFFAAAFIVPGWWSRIAPPAGRTGSFDDFVRDGIDCETGHVGAASALVQVLIMPVMLLVWAVAIAIIHASV